MELFTGIVYGMKQRMQISFSTFKLRGLQSRNELKLT